MPADQAPHQNPRLTFAATLPVKVPPRFAALELLAAVCDLLEGTGVTATIDPEMTAFEEEVSENRFFGRSLAAPRIALNVNSVTVTVVGEDKPPFSEGELDHFDFADWTSGKDRFARARGHIALRELDSGASADLDLNYDRATALTVVATAINRMIGTIGMIWHTSNQAVSGERMPQMFKNLLAGDAPVEVWIARLPLPNGANGVATRGFLPLLGAEIAVLSKQLSVAEAGQAANVLAADILRSGEAPGHGERLQYDRGLRFQVEHRAVGVDGGVPVVVLADITHMAASRPSGGVSGGASTPPRSDASRPRAAAEPAPSEPAPSEPAAGPSSNAEARPAPSQDAASGHGPSPVAAEDRSDAVKAGGNREDTPGDRGVEAGRSSHGAGDDAAEESEDSPRTGRDPMTASGRA